MSDRPDETRVSREYVYRRELRPVEMIPAIGIGVAVGLAAFYVAKLLAQRTPLVPGGKLAPIERLDEAAPHSARTRGSARRASSSPRA
jgi:hypothetical protein